MLFRSRISLLLALCLAPALHAQDARLTDPSESNLTGIFPGSCWVIPARPHAVRPALSGLTPGDWTLLGAAAALRYLDYQTTVKTLSDPAVFHEVELPQALVDNHPGLAAFETSTVVANVWIYRLMVCHGHRRLARAGQLINLGAVGGTVAFNEYNLAKYYPHKPH
jgi:hypothetical protein